MGWSFCGHFCVVGESFHSRFLLKNAFSWAAQNKTAIHKQREITSFLINDWVTAKIGLNGLDPDLDQNKHRINLELVRIE